MIDHHIHFLENFLENNASPDEMVKMLEEYIETAKSNKITTIGFAEHAYLFKKAGDIVCGEFQEKKREQRIFELKDYLKILNKIKNKYPEMNILVGLEVDYREDKEEDIKNFLNQCQDGFDFFIGSAHYLDDWPVDVDEREYRRQIEQQGVEQVYKKYYEAIEKMVESKMFDIIGHMDLIKKLGARYQNDELENQLVETLAKHQAVIEINSNGFDMAIKEQYPSDALLKKLIKADVKITLSSDAHHSNEVAQHFNDKILKILEKYRIGELVYFKDKELKIEKLEVVK